MAAASQSISVSDDRARICELIAMNTTALATHASLDPLRDVIQETVRRNDDILSAAVRRQDGTLVVMAGDHATCWKALPEGKSTATQVRLPLRDAHRHLLLFALHHHLCLRRRAREATTAGSTSICRPHARRREDSLRTGASPQVAQATPTRLKQTSCRPPRPTLMRPTS